MDYAEALHHVDLAYRRAFDRAAAKLKLNPNLHAEPVYATATPGGGVVRFVINQPHSGSLLRIETVKEFGDEVPPLGLRWSAEEEDGAKPVVVITFEYD